MNVENNDSLFSTPIRRRKRTLPSATSSSTPSTPCSQCVYMFHNPHELQELNEEINSLKQNIRHLLQNIEELTLISKQHQEREASIAASITYIKQRPIHHNINITRYKHKTQLHKRKMCWKRRYSSYMHIFTKCLCHVIYVCVYVFVLYYIQALSKSFVCGLD